MGQLLLVLLIAAAIGYGLIRFYGTAEPPSRSESIDPQAIPNQYKQDLENALRIGVERQREIDSRID